MNILTLIPSATVYGVMLLATLSLGSFNIARHIHIRWLKNKFSFMSANAIVKGSIALAGLAIIPLSSLFAMNLYHEIYSLISGIICGFLTVFIEEQLIRNTNRKNLITKNHKAAQQENILRTATINTRMSLSSSPAIAAQGIADIRKSYARYADNANFLNYSLLAVMIVAVAEEFLFRGYLIAIACWINSLINTALIILLSLLIFSFSHLANSWREFIYKLPLAIFTTISFVTTGSLTGAIIIHLFLNIHAYTKIKKITPVRNQNNYLPIRIKS